MASKPAEAKSAPSASKAPEAKKTTEPVAESTMGEGTYQIGVDAKPGRYKTQVPQGKPEGNAVECGLIIIPTAGQRHPTSVE